MTQFEGIVPALGAALEKRGYTALTPVQQAMLAPELAQADALVSAQTGSGKTVAFGIALAPSLLAGAERFGYAPAPLALVVAPTRELALQVQRELDWLYAETGAIIASCVGGMDYRTERRALERGAHIVVGTPGRLRDHIERQSLDLSALRAAVLDEADEMLDLGFREDLEFILDAAPADRRTLMFSATVSKPIATLAQSYQRDAVRVATQGERRQHVDIEYRALQVAAQDRENAIINVLRYYEAQNALVFCSTRAAVNHLMARFNNRGFSVVALSGELSQNERTHALQAMRDGRARVCIATDVAARGIDLPGLELVIHADLPQNRETLLHRSGRTGRAGNKGVSALIVAPNDRKKAERLLATAGINATWARPPSADDVTARDNERLLGSPALAEPVGEEDTEVVAALLAAHAPDQIAAAFVRLWRTGRSAPEELRDAAEPARRDRAEFPASVWLRLSVGRQQNAEPRWLLPMLCGAGQITKAEIGAIRMLDDETHVQLAAHVLDGFLAAVGPDMTLEKGITLAVMDQPGTPRSAPRKPYTPREDRPAQAPKPRRDEDSPPARQPAVPASAPVAAPASLSDLVRAAPAVQPKTEAAPKAEKPAYDPDRAVPRKPYKPKPDDRALTEAAAPKKPYRPRPAPDAGPAKRPYADKSGGFNPGPRGEGSGKPAYRPREAAEVEAAPRRTFSAKSPDSARSPDAPRPKLPGFDPSDPSASRRKPTSKPYVKAGGKGPAKAGGKAGGKSNAARFTRPDGAPPKRPKPKG